MPPKKEKQISAKNSKQPLARTIIDTMRKAGRPLFLHEIVKLSELNSKERKKVMEEALKLCASGELVELKGGRFGLTEMMSLIKGKLSMHRDGYGFVTPEGGGAEDIFISRNNLKSAVHGDLVMVRIEPSKAKTRRLEGSVIRVLERSLKKIIGTFHKGKSLSIVSPEDERLTFEVIIPKKHTLKAQTGAIVIAEITDFDLSSAAPEGRIIEILGDENDLAVQAKIVAHRHELPQDFSEKTFKEISILPDEVTITPEELIEQGRKDLRHIPFITIDGETAKDFDDAVWAQKNKTGYKLLVAIADVSHYVNIGSFIDKDATERSTSVYFPNSVIPMLPEALSNNLCSLVPDKDRLALVAEMRFDRQGYRQKETFYTAVIRNHRRCTYTEIAEELEKLKNTTKKDTNCAFPPPLLKTLRDMSELSRLLTQVRQERGSIDFDLPEPFVVIGITGNIEDIIKRERNAAHQLIEEFMLAANEAVADFFTGRLIPALYRIHEPPDPQKLDDFREFVSSLGIILEQAEDFDPAWCQNAIKKATNQPYEYLVNTVLLRSMRQAVYSPTNKGHFGLASKNYLHFTSPIRRYPDLVTHRILKSNLKKRKNVEVYPFDTLEKLGADCSKRERAAIEAEREMLERLKARFMSQKVGEVFEAIISGVASFGFFVELKDIFVEGAVRMVDLTDDYYECDIQKHRLIGQKTRKIYQLGMPVTVRLKTVNVARRHLNFEVVEQKNTKAGSAHSRGNH